MSRGGTTGSRHVTALSVEGHNILSGATYLANVSTKSVYTSTKTYCHSPSCQRPDEACGDMPAPSLARKMPIGHMNVMSCLRSRLSAKSLAI